MPESAVVVAPKRSVSEQLAVTSIAGRGNVTRIDAHITIPASYQYIIPKWERQNGQMVKTIGKVGLSAAGYEYINRVLGATTFLPKTIHDADGHEQPNPIHRGDYTYGRMGIVWYNAVGQLVSVTEDFEVDFMRIYADTRANARSAEIVIVDGEVQFDKDGNPKFKLSAEDEKKAAKELTQLRRFGPRYGQTVQRVRLLKIASTVRELPLEAAGRDWGINVTCFRDNMTPTERIEAAASTEAALFGDVGQDTEPLSREELAHLATLAEAEESEVIEKVDRENLAPSHPDAEPPE